MIHLRRSVLSRLYKMFIKSFTRAPYALLILNIMMFVIFTILQSSLQDLHDSVIENERVSIEKMNELFFREMNNNITLTINTNRIDAFDVDELQTLYNRFNIEYDLNNEYAVKYLLTCNYDKYTMGYYCTMIRNSVEYRIVSYTKDQVSGNLCLINENNISTYLDHTNPDYYNPFSNSYNFDNIENDNPGYIGNLYELGVISDDPIFKDKHVLSSISKLTYNPNRDPVKMSISIDGTEYSYYYLTIPNIGTIKSNDQHRKLIFLNFINEDALSDSFNQRNSVLMNIINIIKLLVLFDILFIAILFIYIKTILQNIKRGDVTAKSIEVKNNLYKSFLDGSNGNDIL